MEIEYKRELTKSYMCVKTDQDFLPLKRNINKKQHIRDSASQYDFCGCCYSLLVRYYRNAGI